MTTLTRDDIQALPTSAAFATLATVVQRLTGRRVEAQRLPSYLDEYAAFEHCVSIPHNDVEGLLHELCHWAVAGPRRHLDNYGLDQRGPNWRRSLQEEICCGWIEENLYAQAGVPMPVSSVHANRYRDFAQWQPVGLSRWRRHIEHADEILVVCALRLPGGDVALWDRSTYDARNSTRRVA